MHDRRIGKFVFLGCSLLLLTAGLTGIARLHWCADESFEWGITEGRIVLTKVPAGGTAWNAGIRPGDLLLEMDRVPLRRVTDVRLIFESRQAGTILPLTVQRGLRRLECALPLLPKYSATFTVLNLLLGLMFWMVGVFVYFKKWDEKPARMFSWGVVILGFSIMAVCEGFPYHGVWWEVLLSGLYSMLYPMVPAFILAFAVHYPRPKSFLTKHPILLPVLFIPGIVFLVLFCVTYARVMMRNPLEPYRLYSGLYAWFRIYMAFYLVLSVASLIHSRRCAVSRADRSKVQWILWAIAIGGSPFVFLWTLPLVLGRAPFIPEAVNYLFMLPIPAAFGFSIVKYHAWDIEVIIQRSIVYALVTSVIAAAYMILAGFVGYELRAVSRTSGDTLTIAFTLAAAALFSPLRRGIQTFVDRHFYKIRVNYRQAIREFSAVLTSVGSCEEATALLLGRIHAAVPAERSMLFLKDPRSNAFEAIGSRGLSEDGTRNLSIGCGDELVRLAETEKSPLALKNRAGPEDAVLLADGSCLEAFGLDCVIPLRMEDRLAGFLGMGEKLSGDKYYREDFQLLTPMAEQCVTACERLRLQEAMILERAEKSKFEELNRLKSEFVSHVSHELRSPLTSIRWSVDNWLDGIPEKPGGKTRPVLESMDDCGRRLDRMIGNLLDVTKIEAGKVDLRMEPLCLRETVEKTFAVLHPLAVRKRIRLENSVSPDCLVLADSDAVRTILENLVENALKYSPEESGIRVESGSVEGNRIRISVIDQGAGIPEDKREFVFERFERVKSEKAERQKGLGLGLHIVKKLVELHGGRIRVESEPGRGSTFSFTLEAFLKANTD
jgi:signal transduction histidine kinase